MSNSHNAFLFSCNNATRAEVVAKRLFGVSTISLGKLLALRSEAELYCLDVDANEIYGPFRPSGTAKMDLDPGAFGGRLRAQLRFKLDPGAPVVRGVHTGDVSWSPCVEGPLSAQAAAELMAKLATLGAHLRGAGLARYEALFEEEEVDFEALQYLRSDKDFTDMSVRLEDIPAMRFLIALLGGADPQGLAWTGGALPGPFPVCAEGREVPAASQSPAPTRAEFRLPPPLAPLQMPPQPAPSATSSLAPMPPGGRGRSDLLGFGAPLEAPRGAVRAGPTAGPSAAAPAAAAAAVSPRTGKGASERAPSGPIPVSPPAKQPPSAPPPASPAKSRAALKLGVTAKERADRGDETLVTSALRPSAEYTVISTDHAHERKAERQISKELTQRVLKRGTWEAAAGDEGRFRVVFEDCVLIVAPDRKTVITTYWLEGANRPSTLVDSALAAPQDRSKKENILYYHWGDTATSSWGGSAIVGSQDYSDRYSSHKWRDSLRFRLSSKQVVAGPTCTSHTVLVVDASGSMRKCDCSDGTPHGTIMRIKAVFECLANDFAKSQLRRGVGGSHFDAVTLIEFSNGVATVVCERQPLTEQLVADLLAFANGAARIEPRGEGNYLPALDTVQAMLQDDTREEYAVCLFILSDGVPSDRLSYEPGALESYGLELESIRRIVHMEQGGSASGLHSKAQAAYSEVFGQRLVQMQRSIGPARFRALTVGFGAHVDDFGILKNMSRFVNGKFSHATLENAELSKIFRSLSETLSETRTYTSKLQEERSGRTRTVREMEQLTTPVRNQLDNFMAATSQIKLSELKLEEEDDDDDDDDDKDTDAKVKTVSRQKPGQPTVSIIEDDEKEEEEEEEDFQPLNEHGDIGASPTPDTVVQPSISADKADTQKEEERANIIRASMLAAASSSDYNKALLLKAQLDDIERSAAEKQSSLPKSSVASSPSVKSAPVVQLKEPDEQPAWLCLMNIDECTKALAAATSSCEALQARVQAALKAKREKRAVKLNERCKLIPDSKHKISASIRSSDTQSLSVFIEATKRSLMEGKHTPATQLKLTTQLQDDEFKLGALTRLDSLLADLERDILLQSSGKDADSEELTRLRRYQEGCELKVAEANIAYEQAAQILAEEKRVYDRWKAQQTVEAPSAAAGGTAGDQAKDPGRGGGDSGDTVLFCSACGVMCTNKEVWTGHVRGKRHRRNVSADAPHLSLDALLRGSGLGQFAVDFERFGIDMATFETLPEKTMRAVVGPDVDLSGLSALQKECNAGPRAVAPPASTEFDIYTSFTMCHYKKQRAAASSGGGGGRAGSGGAAEESGGESDDDEDDDGGEEGNPTDPSVFKAGTKVVLVGLQRATAIHLNGATGVVVTTLSSGRVAVELKDKHHGQFSFAPENLQRVKKVVQAAAALAPAAAAAAAPEKSFFGHLLEGAANTIARLKGQVQAETDTLEKEKLRRKLRRQIKLKDATGKSSDARAADAPAEEAPAELATAGWHGMEYSPALVTKAQKFFGQGAERVVFHLKLEYHRRLKKKPKKKKGRKRAGGDGGDADSQKSIVEFLVAKEGRYHEDLAESFKFHKQFAETQLVANDLAEAFNARVNDVSDGRWAVRVEFITPRLVVVKDDAFPNGRRCILAEKLLDTVKYRWLKWNSNDGRVLPKGLELESGNFVDPAAAKEALSAEFSSSVASNSFASGGSSSSAAEASEVALVRFCEFLQAFSHFSYQYSNGDLLVCDLQGVFEHDCEEPAPPADGGGGGDNGGAPSPPRMVRVPTFRLTDPVIHDVSSASTRSAEDGWGRLKSSEVAAVKSERHGRTDRRQQGIHDFFASHRCGAVCRLLGLRHNAGFSPNQDAGSGGGGSGSGSGGASDDATARCPAKVRGGGGGGGGGGDDGSDVSDGDGPSPSDGRARAPARSKNNRGKKGQARSRSRSKGPHGGASPR